MGDMITNISETTRSEIEAVMQNAVEMGINPIESERSIRSEVNGSNKSRALTIARTETLGASSVGADEGAKSLNIPLKKTWFASFINTRDWHADANNQVRSMDSPFTVNGEQLKYPRDRTLGASAENVINCRCVAEYLPMV